MKSIGKILEELGFNPNASAGSQEAFFRHLANAARELSPPTGEAKNKTSVENSVTTKNQLKKPKHKVSKVVGDPAPLQLSFGFMNDKRVS